MLLSVCFLSVIGAIDRSKRRRLNSRKHTQAWAHVSTLMTNTLDNSERDVVQYRTRYLQVAPAWPIYEAKPSLFCEAQLFGSLKNKNAETML